MLKEYINKLKKDGNLSFNLILATLLFLVFSSLISFFILQSDDYYYASFWKNGLFEFIRLSAVHFMEFNGRVLVHFCAQSVLSLPRFLTTLINSFIVLLTGIFAFRFSGLTKKEGLGFLVIFYSLLFLSGRDVLKESVMWVSAFYNYFFPALLALFALSMSRHEKKLVFIAAFLAGATTEQWGISAAFMLFSYLALSMPIRRSFKTLISHFSPVICALAGYITIFLSPATSSRLSLTGHTSVSGSLIDLPRLSNVFMSANTGVLILITFTVLTILTPIVYKGRFKLLYIGFLPLILLIAAPFSNVKLASLIIFVCYLVLCFFVFFSTRFKNAAIYIVGALTSVLVMIPTNTFEPRISMPAIILLIIASASILCEIKKALSVKLAALPLTALTIVSLIVFYPSYTGFFKNRMLDIKNLNAIQNAKMTNELIYNIDYDKRFVMNQMFNDGWFYNEFISLYSLEDCSVRFESESMVSLDGLSTRGIKENGVIYIPMRELLNECMGTITTGERVVMSLNGKSLTYSYGMLEYTNKHGKTMYLIADKHKLADFYTICIDIDTVNNALGTNIKAL